MIAIKKSCCADFGTATFVAFGIISVREKEKGLKSRLTGRMRAFQGQKKAFSYEKARFEKDPSHSKKGSIIMHLTVFMHGMQMAPQMSGYPLKKSRLLLGTRKDPILLPLMAVFFTLKKRC